MIRSIGKALRFDLIAIGFGILTIFPAIVLYEDLFGPSEGRPRPAFYLYLWPLSVWLACRLIGPIIKRIPVWPSAILLQTLIFLAWNLLRFVLEPKFAASSVRGAAFGGFFDALVTAPVSLPISFFLTLALARYGFDRPLRDLFTIRPQPAPQPPPNA